MSLPQSEHIYTTFALNGVLTLSIVGMLSLISVLFVLVWVMPRTDLHQRTQMLGLVISLMVSNVVQSVGTVMSLRWVQLGGVLADTFCGFQGGIKQAGNVGNALWSFAISLHLFNFLFLRSQPTKMGFIATLVIGWFFILFIVIIGPTAIQRDAKGPYFGVSGDWCWITDAYPSEQTFLEYFFEYLSAGASFLLYTAIWLRVRGNLIIEDRRPRLRFVSKEDSWQLGLGRDFTDLSVLRAVQRMVWYPVTYSILIIPIGIARLSEFAGAQVPEWATIVTDVIFNFTGLVNVVVLLITQHRYPELHSLPRIVTRRKQVSKSIQARHGIEPFMLGLPEAVPAIPVDILTAKPLPPVPAHIRTSSISTVSSYESADSLTPLNDR